MFKTGQKGGSFVREPNKKVSCRAREAWRGDFIRGAGGVSDGVRVKRGTTGPDCGTTSPNRGTTSRLGARGPGEKRDNWPVP